MSLYPYNWLRSGDWWDTSNLGRLFDQDFGVGLWNDDPFFSRPSSMMPYWLRSRSTPIVASSDRGISEVSNDSDKFTVNMDVSHFNPEEIKVKVSENNLVVEGKHEEKMDQHGFVSRSFTRRYVLPKDVDPETLTSNLTGNGVLHIEAPKKCVEKAQERFIPIQFGSASAATSSAQQQATGQRERKIDIQKQ